MAQYSFGTGVLYGKSTSVANATPSRFAGLQGVTIDIAFSVKELFGQYQFPIAIGRGTGKITGKATWAQFNARAFNDLFFGQLSGPSTGALRQAVAEAQTVSANIITATNNATYQSDYGVVYSANGGVLIATANAPLAGQYSVNQTTGVYTFNASQNGVAMLISYSYQDAANGSKISITNQLLGNAPTFAAVFTETFNGQSMTLVLNQCMSSKMAIATKLEDFTIPEFDFEAFADSGNNIGSLSLDQ